jgi:hypothetical protein
VWPALRLWEYWVVDVDAEVLFFLVHRATTPSFLSSSPLSLARSPYLFQLARYKEAIKQRNGFPQHRISFEPLCWQLQETRTNPSHDRGASRIDLERALPLFHFGLDLEQECKVLAFCRGCLTKRPRDIRFYEILPVLGVRKRAEAGEPLGL